MALVARIQQKAWGIAYTKLFGDRRCRFYDFANIESAHRKPRSPVIQFYSSVDNIGNYLPVLGMQEMLDHTPDTWCIHDKQIDFDFINKNYKCAIIGGAGLLHQSFDLFWTRFAQECKLPTIIWGVGICLPDESGVRTDLPDSTARSGVNRQAVMEVAQRCDLINVRDDLTAEYYNLSNAQISACPTIAYLDKFEPSNAASDTILYSSHEELVSSNDRRQLKLSLQQSLKNFQYTDNIQRPYQGLEDLIQDYYCNSKLVITTRLHGAIVAYGLGTPYIAIVRDEKLREFHRIYGNGIKVQEINDLKPILETLKLEDIHLNPIDLEPVAEFGKAAKHWFLTHSHAEVNHSA